MKANWAGIGIVAGSGAIGGSVVAQSPAGSVVRRKVTPINPQTTAQTNVRTRVATNAQAWANTLTQAQRDAWNAAAVNFPVKNIWGDVVILSGIALYQRLNLNITLLGGAAISVPPLNSAITGITGATLIANHTGPVLTMTMLPATGAANEKFVFFATPAMSPGRKFVRGSQRFIQASAIVGTAISLSAAWIAINGTFPAVAGQKISVLTRIGNSVTGAMTPGFLVQGLVI